MFHNECVVPIMRNVPKEVINVDSESDDDSVYSHPIGPERRPIAQMRPVIQPRNQPVQKDSEQSGQGTQMEEETEEENRSITEEEEPQLMIQQSVISSVQKSTQTMSDDSETESDSETVEVNWN